GRFDGAQHSELTRPMYMFDLNDELVGTHHSFVSDIGLFNQSGGNKGFFLQLGGRYIWTERWGSIKPGIDFYYYNGTNVLGCIDNDDKAIKLYGFTADRQFNVDESDGTGGSGTY